MVKYFAYQMTVNEAEELLRVVLDDSGIELTRDNKGNDFFEASSDTQWLSGAQVDQRLAQALGLDDCRHIAADDMVVILSSKEEGKGLSLGAVAPTLRDRDFELERLWESFADIPMNPETECIEERFLHFEPGTDRKDIWHWFDARHSKGVAYLLYRGEGADRTDRLSRLLYLKQLCPECESSSCGFNHGGECRFPMVHERAPYINDTDGCLDFDYTEG